MPVYPGDISFTQSDMIRDVTALMVYEDVGGKWIVRGRAVSGRGNHAEEELANDLNGANLLGISQGATILIEITKSPCHFHDDGKCCSNVLAELKSSGRLSDIKVKYLGIYKTTSYSDTWRSLAGMVELEVSDIKTEAWDYTQSPNPNQITFMQNYTNKLKRKALGNGRWTNPDTRYEQTRKKPRPNFWTADM